MAEPDSNPQQEEQRLKYLEFVQVATLHALLCTAKLYTYAKDKLGPLKPVADTVEIVVGPAYEKFHGVPIELLKFVDRKVDESISKVQSRVPPTLKEVSTQAFESAHKAPAAARSVMSEVKNSGVVGAASGLAKTMYAKYEPAASGLAKTVYAKYEPAAKDLYSKYEPVAEQYAVSAWRSLNQLPLFPHVAQAVGPTASYCSDKYNQTVRDAADKGYKVASHLPLLPTQKIAKVLST